MAKKKRPILNRDYHGWAFLHKDGSFDRTKTIFVYKTKPRPSSWYGGGFIRVKLTKVE